MKIKVLLAAASLAVAAIAGSAQAATYDFQYTFTGSDGGETITGSFTGDSTNGINDITNIGNVTLALDGTSLGAFNVFSYHPTSSSNCGTSNCFTPGGATVSNDSSLSNFFFSKGTSDALTSNYFYVIQPWSNPGTTIATQYQAANGSQINAFNGQFTPANFSVTAVSAAPEPAAWALLMVAVGMIGSSLRLRRRRGAVAAA